MEINGIFLMYMFSPVCLFCKTKCPARKRTGQTTVLPPGSASSGKDDSSAHILRGPRKRPLAKAIPSANFPFPAPQLPDETATDEIRNLKPWLQQYSILYRIICQVFSILPHHPPLLPPGDGKKPKIGTLYLSDLL